MGDKLLEGAIRAIKGSGGSTKTQYNHIAEATRFIGELRDAGYGVQKWSNITMKHVAEVVQRWQDRDLSPATIKEYLSGVRVCARFYGNDRITESTNAEFGVENRIYVDNTDKSLSQDAYQQAVDQLKASPDPRDHAVAAQMQLQRERLRNCCPERGSSR